MESPQTTEVRTLLRNISVKLSTKPSQEKAKMAEETKPVAPAASADPAVSAKKDILEERRSKPFKTEIVWFNAIGFLILHLFTLYSIYRGVKGLKIATGLWALFIGMISAQSVLLGAHRCYTHKAFKATLPLRLLIVFWQTVSSQNCLWVWVRDHRQHHKYSDTNADPHNASRGFFFSHIGWLMVRKHPDVIFRGRQVDMSDIEADSLVMFQKKYYNILYVLLSIVFPTIVPVYFWNESWWDAFLISFVGRTFVVLNIAWLVNSWAHMFGTRPYNKDILPSESRTVSMLTMGEGWHNYHHTFPWDYRAAEFGMDWNLTASIIDMFAKIGWAYDLKTAPQSLVEKRITRCGDGTHFRLGKRGVTATQTEQASQAQQPEEGPFDDLEAVAFYSKKTQQQDIVNGKVLNGNGVRHIPPLRA